MFDENEVLLENELYIYDLNKSLKKNLSAINESTELNEESKIKNAGAALIKWLGGIKDKILELVSKAGAKLKELASQLTSKIKGVFSKDASFDVEEPYDTSNSIDVEFKSVNESFEILEESEETRMVHVSVKKGESGSKCNKVMALLKKAFAFIRKAASKAIKGISNAIGAVKRGAVKGVRAAGIGFFKAVEITYTIYGKIARGLAKLFALIKIGSDEIVDTARYEVNNLKNKMKNESVDIEDLDYLNEEDNLEEKEACKGKKKKFKSKSSEDQTDIEDYEDDEVLDEKCKGKKKCNEESDLEEELDLALNQLDNMFNENNGLDESSEVDEDSLLSELEALEEEVNFSL